MSEDRVLPLEGVHNFRDFGGYHAVLAGLDRLDTPVGEAVQAGEPVGVMPGWDPKAGDPKGGGGRPGLYVELRRGGQPVDPSPWLRGKS